MRYLFYLIFFLLTLTKFSFSQCIEIKQDTISYCSIYIYNNALKEYNVKFNFFEINGRYYNGSNYPFIAAGCNNSTNNIEYYNDYRNLINIKQQSRFLKKFNKQFFIPLSDNETKTNPIFNCVMEKYKLSDVSYKTKRIVAVYFFVDCSLPSGIGNPPVCPNIYIKDRYPIIISFLTEIDNTDK